jgi:hypothetical protein
LTTSIKSEIASTAETESEDNTAQPASESPSIEAPPPSVDGTPPAQVRLPVPSHATVSQGYVYLQHPRGLQPSWHDPNVLNVVNPRHWGPQAPVPVSEAAITSNFQTGGENSDQAWGADDTLAEWRKNVSEESTTEDAEEATRDEAPPLDPTAVEEAPDRPNSVPPVLPPVTAYISSESSVTSKTSSPKPPPVQDDGTTTPPLVHDTPSPPPEDPLPTPPGPSGRRPIIAHVEVDGQVQRSPPRAPRPLRRFGPGSSVPWWKKEPHPAYSAEFSARRVLAT